MTTQEPIDFVPYEGLRERGIPYTRVHINRMMAKGEFPLACALSPNRIAWRLDEINAWKANRPRVRSSAAA